MALSFVNNTLLAVVGGTDTTVDVGTPGNANNLRTGDLILCMLSKESIGDIGGLGGTGSFTPPDGWTLLDETTYGSDGSTVALFSHVYTAGETSWTFDSTYQETEASVYAIRSSYGTVVIAAHAVNDGNSSVAPALVATLPGTWGVYAFTLDARFQFSVSPVGGGAGLGIRGTMASDGTVRIHEWADTGGPTTLGQQPSYSLGSGPAAVAFAVMLADATTPKVPTLSSPGPNASADLTAPTFKIGYNNIDGTTLAAMTLRIKLLPSGASQYFDPSTGTLGDTEVVFDNTTGEVDIPEGVLTNGNQYAWSSKTESSAGLTGDYAPDQVVTGQAPPTVTVTKPVGTVSSSDATVVWAGGFPAPAVQTAYEVWIYQTSDTLADGFEAGVTPSYEWYSGVVAGNAVQATSDVLTNGSVCTPYVRLTETGGETSAVTAGGTFTVEYAEPGIPLIVASDIVDPLGNPALQATVTSQSNLLTADDASYEGSLGSAVAGTNSKIELSTTYAGDGSFSLKLTATA